jgi:hypothetical protein
LQPEHAVKFMRSDVTTHSLARTFWPCIEIKSKSVSPILGAPLLYMRLGMMPGTCVTLCEDNVVIEADLHLQPRVVVELGFVVLYECKALFSNIITVGVGSAPVHGEQAPQVRPRNTG